MIFSEDVAMESAICGGISVIICQKAFTTGVPSLQRPGLVTACEDFSNVIGSMLDGTVYKGTLSSGVEIAVTSTAITSAKDWTKNLETQFRNKIEMLSKPWRLVRLGLSFRPFKRLISSIRRHQLSVSLGAKQPTLVEAQRLHQLQTWTL